MPKISVRNVRNYTDCRGKVRSYYGRGPGSVALTARPIGSPEWLAQYYAASSGGPLPATMGVERSEAGSFNAVIAQFMASPEYRKVGAKTKRGYTAPFAFLREKIGKGSVAALRRRMVVELLEQNCETPGAYNSLLVAIRKIVQTAIKHELRDDDPTVGLDKMAGSNPFGRLGWTDAHIEAFRKRHALGTMARLALEAGYATGLRVSDLCRVGRQHLGPDGKSFEIVPVKTAKFGTIVVQPIRDPAFVAALATAPVRGQRAFLCTVTGKDFTAATLTDHFAVWCKQAGLPDAIRAHGLRKACAVRLSHAGASTHEIMAWIGDRDPKMVELYTKARDTRLLSESGADKLAIAARG